MNMKQSLTFLWRIPSDVSIDGNELSNEAAMDATTALPMPDVLVPFIGASIS